MFVVIIQTIYHQRIHFLIPPVDILMVPICSPVPSDSRVRHAHCSSEQTKEAHKDHLCHCTQLICLAQQMGFRGDCLEHYLSFHFHLHTRGIIYSQFPHYSAQHFSWDCISVSFYWCYRPPHIVIFCSGSNPNRNDASDQSIKITKYAIYFKEIHICPWHKKRDKTKSVSFL